jgi:glycosyltransferase involved in cell wall biosynthesis
MAIRCVHITTVHAPEDPRILHKEIATMREAGYDTLLVAGTRAGEDAREGVIRSFKRRSGTAGRAVNLRRAYVIARSLEPSFCHVHDPEVLPVAYMLKRATGCRVVYDMHEMYRRRGTVSGQVAHRVEQWALNWVDHVVVANAPSVDDVQGSGVPYTLLPNYVLKAPDGDPVARSAASTPMRILYAGVLGRARGVGTMLDLAEMIMAEGLPWTLDLVGRYPIAKHRAADEKRIHRNGLARVVRIEGWADYVPWQRIRRCQERADVGLALSERSGVYEDTIPTKFFEYAYHGIPIVCSNFHWWRQWVEEHRCGVVVDPRDVQAITAVLLRLHQDRAFYSRLSEAAVTAARRYTWDRVEGRLIAAYAAMTAR